IGVKGSRLAQVQSAGSAFNQAACSDDFRKDAGIGRAGDGQVMTIESDGTGGMNHQRTPIRAPDLRRSERNWTTTAAHTNRLVVETVVNNPGLNSKGISAPRAHECPCCYVEEDRMDVPGTIHV